MSSRGNKLKVCAWVAISADGFVARKDGSIDWMETRITNNQDCGLNAFKDECDAVVMGRRTFEKICEFKHWSFKQRVRVYVLSSKPVMFPKSLPKLVQSSSECPEHLVRRLSAAGLKQVWVDGPSTIQSFIRAKMLDEITINTFPVLIGEGMPLFSVLGEDVALRLADTNRMPFGIVQTVYSVVKPRKGRLIKRVKVEDEDEEMDE